MKKRKSMAASCRARRPCRCDYCPWWGDGDSGRCQDGLTLSSTESMLEAHSAAYRSKFSGRWRRPRTVQYKERQSNLRERWADLQTSPRDLETNFQFAVKSNYSPPTAVTFFKQSGVERTRITPVACTRVRVSVGAVRVRYST